MRLPLNEQIFNTIGISSMFETGERGLLGADFSWQEDKKIAARDGVRAAMLRLILRVELLWNG